MDWVELTDDAAVVTDQAHIQSDASPTTSWSMDLIDAGGRHRLGTGGQESADVPVPRASGRVVTWVEGESPASTTLAWAQGPSYQVTRVGVPGLVSASVMDEGHLGLELAKGTDFRVAIFDLSTRRMRELAKDAAEQRGGSGYLVWEFPALGQPQGIDVSAGGQPTTVTRGRNGDNAVVNPWGVAYFDDDGSVDVVDHAGHLLAQGAGPSVAARIASDAHSFAYATQALGQRAARITILTR